MRRCPSCDQFLRTTAFGKDARRPDGRNIYCRTCVNAKAKAQREKFEVGEYSKYQMAFRKSTPERQAKWEQSRRKTHLKTKYNLTVEEWEAMFEAQDGACSICLTKFSSRKDTHVDHDHETGMVRELLCSKCNSVLGLVGDSQWVLSQAITYIRRNQRKVA